MTHPEHLEGHNMGEPQSHLLYSLNNKPPLKDALFIGLRYVYVIFIPVWTPSLSIKAAEYIE